MKSQKRQRIFIVSVMVIAFGSIVLMWLMAQSLDNNESLYYNEKSLADLFCENADLVRCWNVSVGKCKKTIRSSIKHCRDVESPTVLAAKQRGMLYTDPVCFTDFFIDAINVGDPKYDKCDVYVPTLTHENIDELEVNLSEPE